MCIKKIKKNKAVVFTLTSNLTFAVACVMLNLKKTSPNIADEIIILHDGISLKDQELLNLILPSRFILYSFPVKDSAVFHQGTFNQFTKMVFAKFECLKLLDEYHNVMLLDYDIVIQKDLSVLFEPCESGIKMMPGNLRVREQLHEEVDDYDMDKEGICASTFVFQDNLKNYNEMYDFCYKSLVKYADKLYMPEQAIFDFMLQEFNIRVTPIDGKVYSPHPTDEEFAASASIIHSYAQPKFWNGIYNELWDSNYNLWLEMGGSKYKPKSILIKNIERVKQKIKSTFSLIYN